jgi:hypothetical protein
MIGAALATSKDSSKEQYPPWQSLDISKADPNNLFNEPESSEEVISTI